ncbi:hypothetical protein FHS57_006336 [Runella defluvii]|uniref:Uncharacterized protein n=1 Tax=Runella defluvii TaxID=370973 RepID=A0A7W5ZT88_9BACT|nr:hypothetical protein [Runella defluvii]MBB3842305.1 hypothetical protein [Runella defluvii]HAK78026.1 hypothetical protein [Runella sp.]
MDEKYLLAGIFFVKKNVNRKDVFEFFFGMSGGYPREEGGQVRLAELPLAIKLFLLAFGRS